MTGPTIQSRAWYEASIADFLHAHPDEIIGRLATNNQFALLGTQRDAWIEQLALLKQHLPGLTGSIFLEFNIPRVGRRIDVVLIVGPIVFVIEFKVGERVFDRASIDQVWDYGLDLKNFHEASHSVFIVPLLVATEAELLHPFKLVPHEDGVYAPIPVSSARLREVIDATLQAVLGVPIDALGWSRAPYRPTPTKIGRAHV